ncbi:hypothetical protein LOZ58_006854 [Ophidiomyces ophidiicola]|uniref:uncharacterized protein n=1 Tax=Ophidiomyces ophidiicola TaxID=1387563 RepID=UPI0020C50F54|nr:uncharacterized protein LOZ57_006903 [Ophidiomyces ophidiicola]KAI1935310.1 hypothetical protein LOZ57_006903 [Ophidiomyces ophidiicola]KAI1955095.1 hypothetical protein LOZ58_006854 [Ophidiomyces ophidiicola]KAI2047931.1 hypothetical protein LOZ43_005506 [Ophidiomyces ophidiicola]KAI2079565.1 hypothetical protein LOZ36_006685 [Ophidiomyces ophidiicola]
MGRGDDALAGRKEENIPGHVFASSDTERKIYFKGRYLSIYDETTEHYYTHVDHDFPTTDYERYTVPPGYTVYIRGASVYFEV